MAEIRALGASPQIGAMLSEILMATVAGGGSVSFMHPLPHGEARAFWDASLAAAERKERIVLGAWDGDLLVGTVSLRLDMPPNALHRAEIIKLMIRPGYRRRGIATRLMQKAEELAVRQGRTLLVLDTAQEDGAAGFYEKLGYSLCGAIPDYALKPHGGLTATLIYWKRLPQK
jgi:ribosomal protein S18 acetylase RimI-like enzyme